MTRKTMQRVNRRTDNEEQEQEEKETEAGKCDECGGNVLTKGSEKVCEDCGLVMEEGAVDRGPEWRAYDAGEQEERSRVGAPTTEKMHDKGLTTQISWQNRDGHGNTLSKKQRKKMSRLRTWNERFRTADSKEQNLKQALGEIDRMGSSLAVPEDVRETASVIYKRCLEENLIVGRSIEAIASAALYTASRQVRNPRSLKEIRAVSRVDEEEVARAYRYVMRELNLDVRPAEATDYVGRIASDVRVENAVEQRAVSILKQTRKKGVHSGKSPVGLAAAAVYAASLKSGDKVTQKDVSASADVSEVTIRNRYQELLENYEE